MDRRRLFEIISANKMELIDVYINEQWSDEI